MKQPGIIYLLDPIPSYIPHRPPMSSQLSVALTSSTKGPSHHLRAPHKRQPPPPQLLTPHWHPDNKHKRNIKSERADDDQKKHARKGGGGVRKSFSPQKESTTVPSASPRLARARERGAGPRTTLPFL
eukprot:1480629-Rhodomonas_salina.3